MVLVYEFVSGYAVPRSRSEVNVDANPTIKLKLAGVLTWGLNVEAGNGTAAGFVHPTGKAVGNWYVLSCML
jgi:hypothetical protein